MKNYHLCFLFILATACAVKDVTPSPGFAFGQTVKVTKGFYRGCTGIVVAENSGSYTVDARCERQDNRVAYPDLTIPYDSVQAITN